MKTWKSIFQIPKETSKTFLTNKKYLSLCDAAFKTRSRDDLEVPLSPNAIICARGDRAVLDEFFKLDIRTPFTLVTIENDEATPQDVTWLTHKYLTRWFSWNANHPDVHPNPHPHWPQRRQPIAADEECKAHRLKN